MVAPTQPGLNWAFNNSTDEQFPDPFADYASTVMPSNIVDALRWCEYVCNNNGIYSSALVRVLSYFITEVTFLDDKIGDDERQKWDKFLNRTLDVLEVVKDVGFNFLAYGNVFASVVVPFTRHLRCEGTTVDGSPCGTEHPLRVVHSDDRFRFQWANYEFRATCQKCGYSGRWSHVDRRSTNEEDLSVKCWDPHFIDIIEDPLTRRCRYVWRIPEKYKRLVRQGYLDMLETVNWEIVECIKTNRNMRFEDGVLFHLKEKPLAGHDTAGWGISRVLPNFRQAWYVQVLHRYNEAIAMDYVIPFRVITPPAAGTGTAESLDPLNNMNLGNFASQVRAMIRRRRRDPGGWHTLPFPVQYQALGGEAQQLAPFELMQQGVSLLLNNIGVPAELHQGNLQVNAAPAALRLFESIWQGLVHGLNRFLLWLGRKVAEVMSWEPTEFGLTKPTVIDDLNDQMARLQLMQSQMVSATTALQGLGLDWRSEMRRILEEQRWLQEQQAKLQKEMDTAALGEQMAQPPPPPAAAPGPAGVGGGAATPPAGPAGPAGQAAVGNALATPPGPNTAITPQDLTAMAQAKAQEMMQLPEGKRQGEMMRLKAQSPTLWGQTKAVMQDIRTQTDQQGGQMVRQQQGMAA